MQKIKQRVKKMLPSILLRFLKKTKTIMRSWLNKPFVWRWGGGHRNDLYKIYTHLTDTEKTALLGFARKIKDRNSIVVEIGSYLGASSCFLAEGLKMGKIYCIDTWHNEGMTEGDRDTYKEFQENTKKYNDKIIAIRGFSFEATDKLKSLNKPISLLFFDGDHSYSGVKTDWDLYSPLLKKGALVIFHDWGWAEGVQKLIREDVLPAVRKQGYLPNMWWGWIK
jgi:predicted O-methyltransferase YrrM